MHVRYAVAIFLPLLIASVVVVMLTLDLVARVSVGANIEDRKRSLQTVESALSSAQQNLGRFVSDNAYWDAAARASYGTLDDSWLSESFATSTEDGSSYDIVLVVDRQADAALGGYKSGESFKPDIVEYFGPKLHRLVQLFPEDLEYHDPEVSIMKTADGLAIVAVSPIVPTTEGLLAPTERPRYLVMLRMLTNSFVQILADQYVVQDLTLNEVKQGESGMAVRDLLGDTVAYAFWVDRRPGDIAKGEVTQRATFALGLLGVVMATLGVACWVLFRKLSRREMQARYAALHDALTGLPNRSALSGELGRLMSRPELPVLLAFIDLDGFKEVNDTYDHATGDRLILAVARGLLVLAGDSMVCRLGGDEFVVLFTGDNIAARGQEFATDLIEFVKAPFDFEGRLAAVGASIGIATRQDESVDEAELMRRADVAMYKAKHDGKNRSRIYTPEFDYERDENLIIERELRSILAEDRLLIVYQPVFDGRTRQMIGVEALARWPEDSAISVSPDRFVQIAERRGLIDDLGHSILHKACRDVRRWPGLKISVNVSPVQLRNPDFVEQTLALVASSGVAAERFELEVTETLLVDDAPRAKRIFEELKRAGVSIALDDFGAGYSSIGYLREFGFDRVKIDRSLVKDVCGGAENARIVRGTLLIASALGLAITAEGIESEDLLNEMLRFGCTDMQGFFLSKPLDASEIDQLLLEPTVSSALVA